MLHRSVLHMDLDRTVTWVAFPFLLPYIPAAFVCLRLILPTVTVAQCLFTQLSMVGFANSSPPTLHSPESTAVPALILVRAVGAGG